MAVQTTNNKPINPRGNDQSPKGYNRAALYSGKALDFDGVNDWVDLAGLTLSGSNQSFAFYLKSDAWGNYDYIFDINPERFIIASQPAGNLGIYDGSSWKSFGEINDTTNTNFFVITIEGTTSKAYLNGVQFGSSLTIASRDFSSATEAALMAQRDGDSSVGANYNGQLSGFKIFNTALTAAQVSDLYNNPEKVVPTGVADSALKLWLPMMEGAGTTAYDGSGNGNHGTISGATWTHGVGSPVAQTAVIDWNKGSNIVVYSEKLDEWGEQSLTATQSTATAPDGSTNAYDLNDADSGQYGILVPGLSVAMAGDYVGSLFVKKTTGALSHYPGFDIGQPGAYVIIDTTNGTTATAGTGGVYSDISVTSYNDDWWRVSAKATINSTSKPMRIWPAISQDGGTLSVSATGINTFWGAQVEQADALGSYVRTGATAQTSPVLLPQGLTSGRDITGVNLFENVRKQGALNLDGNSWAEVHDNASLDFGTGAFTLEAWAKFSYVSQGSSLNAILTLGGDTGQLNQGRAALVSLLGSKMSFYYNASSHSSTSTFSDGDWVHFVGVYDETNAIVYINGAEESTTARTASSITNTDVKMIGRDSIGTRYYNGPIAQPRIYDRALTAEEVQRNYNAGKNIYTND